VPVLPAQNRFMNLRRAYHLRKSGLACDDNAFGVDVQVRRVGDDT